ncbi:hypothetical protein MauCBS54593_006213 [Microsporum audouinii]
MAQMPISFVNEEHQSPGRPARKGVKQFHRKSRVGCQRCRTKRVKCDETKPVCHNCERVDEPCIYDRLPKDEPKEFNEPAETRARRMLELELMHLYITETGPSIAFDRETSFDIFVKSIPRMAFQSDALLYGIYAVTALHQAKASLSPSAMLDHHQRYLQLAFQHHHKELASFSGEKADVTMLTTHLMRLMASVMLSERSLEPYTPPIEWLQITNSNAKMFRAAWEVVGDDPSTCMAKLVKSTLAWDQRESVKDLQHLLLARTEEEDDKDNPDCWTTDIRKAYESTLGYIEGVLQAIQSRDGPPGPIRRRIMVFPLLVNSLFIDLVAKGRPRALVILAHYFALVVFLEPYWFIGNTGSREVRAIAAHLPTRWQGLMELPLRIINSGFPYKA